MARAVRASLAAGLVTAAMAASLGLSVAGASAASAAGATDSAPGRAAGPAGSSQSSQCIGRASGSSQTVPWTQQLLQPSQLWGMTTGAGQVVAVLDTGVSATAPALSGAVLPGRNVLSGGAANTDCLGHGTVVAGLIAGRPVPGTAYTGMAPGASILPVNVVSTDSESGDSTVSAAALAAGIRYAVSAGATVIDVSAAATPGPSAALLAAVRFAAARNVVVVAPASGMSNNSSDGNGQTGYPGAYPGVLAVSAVDSGQAPVGSSGTQAQPDLAAPGVSVPGLGPKGLGPVTASGDGIATAFVAGTAALVRSYWPRLSARQVAARLEATAEAPGTAVPNSEVGYGVVDPYTAVTTVLPAESGGRAPPMRQPHAMRLPPLVPSDPWPLTGAMVVCAAVLAGLIVALFIAHVVPSGRQRHWRPAPGWGQRARQPAPNALGEAASPPAGPRAAEPRAAEPRPAGSHAAGPRATR